LLTQTHTLPELSALDNSFALFTRTEHALEKESLRVDRQAHLQQSPHPKALGSPLTNPSMSLDFAEAQPEIITPVFDSIEETLSFLHDYHKFTYHKLGNEYLWPYSTPCIVPSDEHIAIAQFGTSDSAKAKDRYRKGLSSRYGRKIQCLSGVHYNFSFSKEIWNYLHKEWGNDQEYKDFVSGSYLHIMRNFFRLNALNIYLFGATPVCDASFLSASTPGIQEISKDSFSFDGATSIRMSQHGYHSPQQKNLFIDYNDLGSFVSSLQSALNTKHSDFENLRNSNLLQIPAELYQAIRLKVSDTNHLDFFESLDSNGIDYIELRAIDLDPFSPIGVSQEQLHFLQLLLFHCLLNESPPLTQREQAELSDNDSLVALHGRLPRTQLKIDGTSVLFTDWASETLSELSGTADFLDKVHKNKTYSLLLKREMEKVNDPSLTPSARILSRMKEEKLSFWQMGMADAEKHKKLILSQDLSEKQKKASEAQVKKSIEKERKIFLYEDMRLDGKMDLELSTIALIKEARERDIQVEILDPVENIVKLKRGNREEIVEKATITSKDNAEIIELLIDKAKAKVVLEAKGISVPKGTVFQTKDRLIEQSNNWLGKDIVIKPTLTNFGIGVHILKQAKHQDIEVAAEEAFTHDSDVIVEEFFQGAEYRFLVIGDELAAACLRVPAHVIADGIHSIADLIDQKNANPEFRKSPKYYLQKGEEEKLVLAKKGYTLSSIPESGKRILLRENSNVSTGGDPIDYTNTIDKAYHEIALQATKATGARFCGVDMIIQDINAAPTPENHSIIELNHNPALWIHRYPACGNVRRVEKDVLNELGF
jgi:glutamate--cysteine ligase